MGKFFFYFCILCTSEQPNKWKISSCRFSCIILECLLSIRAHGCVTNRVFDLPFPHLPAWWQRSRCGPRLQIQGKAAPSKSGSSILRTFPSLKHACLVNPILNNSHEHHSSGSEWSLSKNETINTSENWRQNLVYTVPRQQFRSVSCRWRHLGK